MKWCIGKPRKDNRAAWEAAIKWHEYYVWFPRVIVIGECRWLVFLEWVERRNIDTFEDWVRYPTFIKYEYRIYTRPDEVTYV